jgi:hypothetical protein
MVKHADNTRVRESVTDSSASKAEERIEEYVVAFAAQLGRIAGTVQTRAEGWMDRESLSKQIAGVRDGAAALLKRLAAGTAKSAKRKRSGGSRGRNKGRSGGVVDAPGKKHRGPAPVDPRMKRADSDPAGTPTAKVIKANRRRGRG